jgi:hypothetical protein
LALAGFSNQVANAKGRYQSRTGSRERDGQRYIKAIPAACIIVMNALQPNATLPDAILTNDNPPRNQKGKT